VVEDEPEIRALIVYHLSREGFRCRTAATGAAALADIRRHPPDLVILDLMLPELDGLELCRRLRADPATAALPLIMLTARADEVDRVVGLELGADDYVTKPFSPKELVARVRALMRRAQGRPSGTVLKAGSVSLDRARHVVELAGTPVALTPREFDLLEALLQAGGRALSREFLLERVWGYGRASEVETRTVDVHVRRLRAKLGAEGRRILTVKGLGYRIEVD
jgi:DNA-binding response OmpR family regulator